MLLLLDELLEGKTGLVTFNGRTFDVPLLNTRYLMNRLESRLLELPHLDLLQPSRRLWRNRFGSVALGNLETNTAWCSAVGRGCSRMANSQPLQ